jgi:ABC-type polar amino acid transport system ATPase subunit
LQKNLQNGQGRQLADDRFGFGVCFQHFSLFPQFVPIRVIRVANFSMSVFEF